MNNIFQILLLSGALCSANGIYAQTNNRIRWQKAQPLAEQLTASRSKLPPALFKTGTSALDADFSSLSHGSTQEVWSENFDNGSEGWELVNADTFSWEIAPDASHPFTEIDPNDKASLCIEGDYRYYNRGTATATSPEVAIPQNATFSGYIGYSLNFNESCTLTLLVSSDGTEWDKLWSSLDDSGERPWAWRKFEADLSAYAGQTIRFRFEYGNTAEYDNMGYMGGFSIDGLTLAGATETEKIQVQTGEIIKFADASKGNPTSWQWNFPGGVPETSTEQYPEVYYTQDGSFDVSLTVSDGTTTSTKTIEKLVTVTGTAPVARILPPATFRYAETHLPMIAPLVPVQFRDASEGFPTSREWTFTGADPDPEVLTNSNEEHPSVGYQFQHQQTVWLTASNKHGSSDATTDVSVEYEGLINNMHPDDPLTSFDLEDGYGEFPGTNKLEITEYAEKFSKPSRPILVYGAYVYFTQIYMNDYTEVADQIADVQVSLCKSENGLPGEKLNSMSWRVFELDQPSGTTLVGTEFMFSTPTVINDEFFMVVSGIPEKNENLTVSFAMAEFRSEGNTAYFKQRGEWKAASEYFPAGANHTSFMISPAIAHSVMMPLVPTPLQVNEKGGTTTLSLFSYMGYKTPVASDADWCRIVSKPNGMTVDDIKIEYDPLPIDTKERIATFSFTDGLSSIDVKLIQSQETPSSAERISTSSVGLIPSFFDSSVQITIPQNSRAIEIFDISGQLIGKCTPQSTNMRIDSSAFQPGIYIFKVITDDETYTVKGIKR